MMGRGIFLLVCLQILSVVCASSVGYGQPPLRTVRGADGDTTLAIKRALNSAMGTTYTLNQTNLTKSWADATLFSVGVSASSSSTNNLTGTEQTLELESALTVTCTACYINGTVRGSLNITNDFNLTSAISEISDQVSNVTETAIDQLVDFASNVTDALVDSVADFDLHTIANLDELDLPAWPTLDLDFDLDDVDGLPDVRAQFVFDDLELYLELDVQLSAGATYTLNLFTSQTVAGISIPGLDAGALFKVSLVLIAEAEIDISSGFHVKLDKGLLLDFELFNRDVSGITLPGGLLEFLPVTISGAGSLRALLQLEASIGFNLATPGVAFFEEFTSASAGISAEVFAYVADLSLGVNATTDEDADCALEAVAEYTLAVGAAAGATVAVFTYQWGPAPNTTVPVWYTTLASVCAGEKTTSTTTPTPTPAPALEARQRQTDDNNLVTTTLTTSTTYTLVSCISTGIANCPAHLQSTSSVSRELTTVLTVSSGIDAAWPVSTFSTLEAGVPFGDGVRTIGATSGVPVSYVPPATHTPSPTDSGTVDSNDEEEEEDGGNDNKLIIGLSVGLGVPALIGVGAGLWWFLARRKKYTSVAQNQSETTVYSPWESGAKTARTTVAASPPST